MILIIDPSICTPGFALFKDKKLLKAACPSLAKFQKEPIDERLLALIDASNDFYNINYLDKNSHVFIEFPDYHYYDKNKKSLELLLKAVGCLFGYYIGKTNVHSVFVSEWKNKASKEETTYEVNHLYPEYKILTEDIPASRLHNALDAIAIGHYVLSAPKYFDITRPINV